jgi:putative hydrolase of the HAD superfamily
MQPERRAVVFDLDDTLYPYRRFKVSGFLAVARQLHADHGLDVRLGFAALLRASRGPDRGREVQACLSQYDLPADRLHELLDAFRHHAPRLRLPRAASRVLATLRGSGFRLGVLTNGQPSIQQRKVAALGLHDHVDTVVYAAAHGRGTGKPDPDTFAEVARRLDVPAARIVFVGDDEVCDVAGATGAGMRAVRCTAWTRRSDPTAAPVIVHHLAQVPGVAHQLLEEAPNRHAA